MYRTHPARTALVTLATTAVLSCGAFALPALAETPAPDAGTAPVAAADDERAPADFSRYADWKTTGQARIKHPTWGTVTVTTAYDAQSRTGVVMAVRDEFTVWVKEYPGMYSLRLATPAQDATGNVFVAYNPGRYPGVSVLRPTSDGFRVLADGYENLDRGLNFYGGELVGPGSDGRYRIRVETNLCTESCASGPLRIQTWAWTGTTYVGGRATIQEIVPTTTPHRTTRPRPTVTKPARTTAPTPTTTRAPRAAAPTATTTRRGVPATTGDADVPYLPIGAGLAAAATGAGYLVSRRRRS